MEDLTGMQFGEWTVLERAHVDGMSRGAKWKCRCSCGTEKIVFGKYLRQGKSLSCGCKKKIDWIGKRFGRLVIQGYRKENGRKVFTCLCDCGNIIDVHESSIRKQQSCGCIRQKDYAGQKYGKLTVDKTLPNLFGDHVTYVSCSCECGTSGFIVRANALVTGNTTSCGCIRTPNLVGMRFGRLTVIKQVNSKTPQRRWLCKCDCGNTSEVQSYQLTSGHSKSCGCLRSEKTSIMERVVFNLMRSENIQYIPECTFDGCVGIHGWKLRFDFYLPDYRLAIECDGEQHFRPVEFFGGQATHDVLVANDAIKNQFCSSNNIDLLRIPYTTDVHDIPQLIHNIIMYKNPVTTTA